MLQLANASRKVTNLFQVALLKKANFFSSSAILSLDEVMAPLQKKLKHVNCSVGMPVPQNIKITEDSNVP
jgi:hypothetical protein